MPGSTASLTLTVSLIRDARSINSLTHHESRITFYPSRMPNTTNRETSNTRAGITLRSVLLGLLMAVFVNIGPLYSGYIVLSSWSDFGHITLAVLLPFFILVGAVNVALKKVRPALALSRAELIVIFSMGAVAATMQGEGLTGHFLGIITAPHYYASGENEWDQHIIRNLPKWLILGDEAHAVGWFYNGMPLPKNPLAGGKGSGVSIPWAVWIVPLFWWFSFFAALGLASFCTIAIMRKQWVENEKLTFPLAEVPLSLVRDTDEQSAAPGLLRLRLFWIGFGVTFLVICWNMMNWFNPAIPQLPLLAGFFTFPFIRIARGFPALHAKVDIFVIGFAYFSRLDVLFSIWFFHLISILQRGIFYRVGYDIGGADAWCSWDAITGWQSLGGFIFFVVCGLWMARRHLKEVFIKACTGRSDIDDSNELLSYRFALFGLLFSTVYMILWLCAAGMGLLLAMTFVVMTFILYIGVSRIVAEGGLVYLRGPVTAQSFAWHMFGSTGLTAPSMAALGLSYSFFCDAKCWIITPFANVAKMSDAIKRNRRWLTPVVGLAAFVGAAAATWFVIYQSYHFGAYNFGASTFNWSNKYIWNNTVSRMKSPFDTDWGRCFFLGVGAAVTAGLTYLRYRFVWWPLHPIGFTVSSVYPIRDSAFGIFIVWLVKLIVLKTGGIPLYRKVGVLFLGLLMGYIVGVGAGFVVDVIFFNGQGHRIHGF